MVYATLDFLSLYKLTVNSVSVLISATYPDGSCTVRSVSPLSVSFPCATNLKMHKNNIDSRLLIGLTGKTLLNFRIILCLPCFLSVISTESQIPIIIYNIYKWNFFCDFDREWMHRIRIHFQMTKFHRFPAELLPRPPFFCTVILTPRQVYNILHYR